MDSAKKAAESIATDVSDRKGLGNEWRQIDRDIQSEVLDTWANIIREAMRDGIPDTEQQ